MMRGLGFMEKGYNGLDWSILQCKQSRVVVETRYDWFSSDELLVEDLIHVDGVRCFRV